MLDKFFGTPLRALFMFVVMTAVLVVAMTAIPGGEDAPAPPVPDSESNNQVEYDQEYCDLLETFIADPEQPEGAVEQAVNDYAVACEPE